MTKSSFQSGAPILSRLKSILAILPKCREPILGGFSPNRGSNNASPPPPSLNHKGVTGVHHEGTRDTSGGGESLMIPTTQLEFQTDHSRGKGSWGGKYLFRGDSSFRIAIASKLSRTEHLFTDSRNTFLLITINQSASFA